MISRRKAKAIVKFRKTHHKVKGIVGIACKSIVRNKRVVVHSILSAIVLSVTNFFVDSWKIPFGGEVTVAQWLDRIGIIFGAPLDNVPDSICLVNVSYDKTLVDYEAPIYTASKDSPTLPVGKITTTDRSKLLKFLRIADSLDNYKFILLDIRFESGMPEEAVSDTLFDLIGKMDKIVFAQHNGYETAKNAPMEKAGYGDYFTTFLVSDVVKYPIVQSESDIIRYSIPLKIFSSLYQKKFTELGPFLFENGKLCRSSIYPTFPIRLSSWAVENPVDGQPVLQYSNLGIDFLEIPESSQVISSSIDGKIVVVGDFNEDIHNTYIGSLPGAIVNLNSYVALCKGQHLVNWAEEIITLIVFFFISLSILSKKSLWTRFHLIKNSNRRLVRLSIALIGYSFILTLYAIVIYMTFGVIFSVVLPSIYFTFLDLCSKSVK